MHLYRLYVLGTRKFDYYNWRVNLFAWKQIIYFLITLYFVAEVRCDLEICAKLRHGLGTRVNTCFEFEPGYGYETERRSTHQNLRPAPNPVTNHFTRPS
jgi:hypothetical protein